MRLRWTAGAAALLLLVAAAAGMLVLRSGWFREQVRQKIISVAENATGGRVELDRFHYDWSSMTARVTGFTLHGKEEPGRPPLLRIPELELAIHIRSLLRRDVELRALRITGLAVHVYVAEDGSTNLPMPPRREPGANVIQELLRLRIGRLEAADGLVHYDSRRIPVEARAEGVNALLTLAGREAIAFSLRVSQVEAWQRQYGFEGSGLLEARKVTVEKARLSRGNSFAELSATVEEFGAPRIAGKVKAEVDLREWPELVLDGGRARVDGGYSWSEAEGLQASGEVRGEGLRADFEDFTFAGAKLDTRFNWRPEDLVLTDTAIRALGGEWRGGVRLKQDRDLEVSGEARGISVAAIAAASGVEDFSWDALLSGPAGLTAQAGARGITGAVARVDVRVEPAGNHLALQGQVAGEWRQREGVLVLEPSHLATPSSRLTVTGVLGESLTAGLFTTNPQDLEPALALITGEAVSLPVRLQGGALQMQAIVTGPLTGPQLSGEATVTQALWGNLKLTRAAAGFRLTAAELELKRLRLEQNGSRLEGEVRLGLSGWRLPENAALNAMLQVKGLRLRDALRQSGVDWPVDGTVNAALEAAGTLDAPRGTIRWQGREVLIGEERFSKADGSLRVESAGHLRVDGDLELDAATVKLSGSYLHSRGLWQDGEASFQLRTAGFRLGQFETVKQMREGVDAALGLEASAAVQFVKGEARLRRLDGFLALDGLRDRNRPLGSLRLEARTADAAVQLALSGNLEETPVSGQSIVRLQARYPAEGSLRVENLPLAAVAAWLDEEQELRGGLTAQLRWRGELAEPRKITALLTIPRFELVPPVGEEIAFRNAGPIQVDIDANGVQVRSARFVAKETSLTMAGVYAFGSRSPWDLSLNGSVNLALLSSFEPDLTASGVAQLSANLRGAADSPVANGRMVIKGGSLYLRGLTNGLENANGVIFFDRDRANIESLTATTGGGTLSLSGFVGFGRGELSYRLQALAKGVRVRYPEGVSTTVDTDLSLTGSANASLLSGLVTVQRSGFSSRGDFASLVAGSGNPVPVPATQNEFLRNLQFDVRVRTSPNATFQTDYTQDLQTEADLRVRGSLAKPVVLGSVNVNQGEINFFGNRYTISRGEILFYNTATIQPSINLDLETRIRGVVVYIGVSGPLTRLNVNYRSEPPLQSREILALLTVGRAPTATATGLQQQGLNPSAQQTGAGTNMLAEASNTLLGGALSASVSSRVEKFFGVSRIKIDPNVTGVENIPQARLTIEQSLSRDITLTFSSNLSRSSQQIIRLEWDLSKQWSAIAVRDENGAFGLDFLFRKRFK